MHPAAHSETPHGLSMGRKVALVAVAGAAAVGLVLYLRARRRVVLEQPSESDDMSRESASTHSHSMIPLPDTPWAAYDAAVLRAEGADEQTVASVAATTLEMLQDLTLRVSTDEQRLQAVERWYKQSQLYGSIQRYSEQAGCLEMSERTLREIQTRFNDLPAYLARISKEKGMALIPLGHVKRGVADLELSLQTLRAMNSPKDVIADHLLLLNRACVRAGQYARARECNIEADKVAGPADPPEARFRWRFNLTMRLGVLHHLQGNRAEAERSYQETLALLDEFRAQLAQLPQPPTWPAFGAPERLLLREMMVTNHLASLYREQGDSPQLAQLDAKIERYARSPDSIFDNPDLKPLTVSRYLRTRCATFRYTPAEGGVPPTAQCVLLLWLQVPELVARLGELESKDEKLQVHLTISLAPVGLEPLVPRQSTVQLPLSEITADSSCIPFQLNLPVLRDVNLRRGNGHLATVQIHADAARTRLLGTHRQYVEARHDLAGVTAEQAAAIAAEIDAFRGRSL